MAGKRIIKPKLTINGVDYKCMSNSITLEPGDQINFCEQEWTCSIDVELAYGTGKSWTLLSALRDTVVVIVVAPDDSTAAAENPTATFSSRIPAIPLLMGATNGERQTFTLDLVSEGEPVFTVA